MKSELKNKSVKGVIWNITENISSYLIRLSLGIVLARLLSPADYGLIAMTVVFFSIAEVLIDSGFAQAFIQKSDANKSDANTVFMINFVISLIIYAALWVTAPLISQFFRQPLLISIIRVMSVVVIINAFNIIQIAIIRKNLDYKRKTLITISASVTSGLVGIICAYKGLQVWSLVIQQVLNKLIICIGLYATSNWRLEMRFSQTSFKKLFRYGSWLLLSNIFVKVFDNLYRVVIGRFFPASSLGLYDKGHQFPSMIYHQVSWSVGSVAFPVYARLSGDQKGQEQALQKFVKYSSFLTLPLLGVLFVVAEPFVLLLLTEKWAGVIPFIRLFCIIGTIAPLYNFFTQYVEAMGYSRVNFTYTFVLNAMRTLNIFLNLRIGIEAILIGEIAVRLVSLVLVSLLSRRLVGFNFLWHVFNIRLLFFSLGISVYLGWIFVDLIEQSLFLKILVPSSVIFAIFFGLVYLLDRKLFLSVIKYPTTKA